MKKLYLVIGIVVILALVWSPTIAVSKSDLIAQYQGQSSPTILTPNPTPTVTPPTLDTYDRFRRTTGNTWVPGPPYPSLESVSEFWGGEWWMKGRRPEPVKCCASGNTSMPTSLYETMSFSDDDSGVSIGVPEGVDYTKVFA